MLLFLLLLPVALIVLPVTMVLVPAMVPTLVARVVDTSPSRHVTITVGCLNFAGSLWFLRDIWIAGFGFAAVGPTLSDMMGWLSALMGAGCGWALIWIMPMFSGMIAAAKSAVRLARVRKRQESLVEQWGEPVRKLVE